MVPLVKLLLHRVVSVALLIALLASGVSLSPAAAAAPEGPGRWLVTFHDYPEGIRPGDTWNGHRVLQVDPLSAFVVVAADDIAPQNDDPDVAHIEPDEPMQLLYTPNDPRYSSQHAPQRIRAPAAWDYTLGETDRVLCVIDTGVRVSHEDLTGPRWLGGYNVPTGTTSVTDTNGHGTHVTGIAAATIDNGKGIAGIGNVPFKHVKVIDSNGLIYTSYVTTAVRWCADNGGDVINLSLGSPSTNTALHNAIKYAVSKGLILFAATGNDGCNSSSCVYYPAAYPEVVAVGCTTSTNSRCSFSNAGPQVELVAPGNSIIAPCQNSNTHYCTKSGTSMSSPAAAGAATLIWSYLPHLTAGELRTVLQDTALDLGATGRDNLYGYGLVDVRAAIDSVVPRFPLTPWYETDFDTGSAPGWTLSGEWRVSSVCPGAFSAPNYLGYHVANACHYDTLLANSGHAYLDVDLRTALQAEVTFMQRYETESTTAAVDRMTFAVSTNAGASWTTLGYWDASSPNRYSWHEISESLDPYVGNTVRIRLTFETVDALNNNFRGWHIDDFKVLATDNFPPIARAGPDQTLSASDGSGTATTTLDGSASSDPWDDGTIVAYDWFRAGALIGTGATPTVVIPIGEHEITLRVTDDGGATATDTLTIIVLPNQPPSADAGPDQTVSNADGTGSETVLLSGSGTDPDGHIVTYAWSLGGTTLGNGNPFLADLPVGTHEVTLTVTDNGGATGTDTTTIVVLPNQVPTAHAGADQTVSDPKNTGLVTVPLDGTASSDPDGMIVHHAWSLGGTEVATGSTPDIDLPHGTHTFTLTVTDNGGATAQDTVAITVLPNLAPTADAGPDRIVGDGDNSGTVTVVLDGSASSDPDGILVAYEWTQSGTVIATTPQANVTLALGTHLFTLTVTDDGGATAATDLVIDVVENIPPVAAFTVGCSTLTCAFNAALSRDEDGTVVSYHWDFGDGATATTTTPITQYTYADPGSYTVCLTVTDNGGKEDTHCANALARSSLFLSDLSSGTDGWTLTGLWNIHDGTCTTPPTKPSYLGFHLPGSCSFRSTSTNTGDAIFAVDLAGSSEPILSFMQRWDTWTGCCNYHHHFVQVRPVGASTWSTLDTWHSGNTPNQPDWTERQYDLSPWAGSAVDVRFRFEARVWGSANDRPGWHIDFVQVAASPVDLIPVNWSPTAVVTGPTSATDTAAQGAVTLTFSGAASTDPDGDVVGWSWSKDGLVLGSGPDLTIELSLGTHAIDLTVVDDGGATDKARHTVTIAPNQPPSAVAGADQTVSDIDGTGTAPVVLDGTASTDDGVIVSYQWTQSGSLLATGGQATVEIPHGTHLITLEVTDEGGATDTDTLQVTVLPNQPPTAIAGADQTVSDIDGTGAVTIVLDGTASSDPDGSIVAHEWQLAGTPIATTALALVDLPIGTHQVTLRVADEAGATDTDTLEVTVLPNQPPVAVAPADIVRNDDDRLGFLPILFDGTASYDPDGGIVATEWTIDGVLVATGPLPIVDVPVGDHLVTLLVRDAANATDTDTFQVRITDNLPPVAQFSVTCGDVLCQFDASLSSDPDGDPLTYHWNHGDGSTQSVTTAAHTHAYPHAGHYTPCLTVDDGHGRTDTTCTLVHLIDIQFAADFNGGQAPGWTRDGLWRVDASCGAPAAGSHYLGYHQGLLCNYQTLDRTTGVASFKLDLRQATEATLSFQTRWQVESTSGTEARDYMRIQVSLDDRPGLFTLRSWDSRSGDRPHWTQETFDLQNFVGERITVRYHFDSMNMMYNHYQGWFIDDVVVVSDAPRINSPPTAALQITCEGTTCLFDASGSTDDRYVVAWDWAFGDGNSDSGETVTHRYSASGTYTATLTVTDNSGATDTTTQTLQVVSSDPIPPIAAYTYTCSGLECHFDGDDSFDPDGDIVAWDWAFGDGATASGATPTHTYVEAGNYTVILTVTDDDGLTANETRLITVGFPAPPHAAFSHTCLRLDCSFDGTASYDPDGTVVDWSWDHGDGTTGSGATHSHTYAEAGTYEVTLTVTDDDGLQGTHSKEILVRDSTGLPKGPPSAAPADPQVPDQQVDLIGDIVPILWMDIESAWFDDDEGHLYVGMKINDIPATDRITSFVAYRTYFTPTWTPADPTLGGRIAATEEVREFEVYAHLSPAGPGGSPLIEYGLIAEVRDSITRVPRSVHLGGLDGSLSTSTDIIWWPLARDLIGAPAADATLTKPHAIASPAIRDTLELYGVTGDRTGTGFDHTF